MDKSAHLHLKTARDDVRIMTLQAHILEQQVRYPQASGTFSWILSALSISAKIIADKVLYNNGPWNIDELFERLKNTLLTDLSQPRM